MKAQAAKTDDKINIEHAWDQFHKTRNNQFRNLLLEHYRDLVRYAAERLHAKLPDKVELDDLITPAPSASWTRSMPTIRPEG